MGCCLFLSLDEANPQDLCREEVWDARSGSFVAEAVGKECSDLIEVGHGRCLGWSLSYPAGRI